MPRLSEADVSAAQHAVREVETVRDDRGQASGEIGVAALHLFEFIKTVCRHQLQRVMADRASRVARQRGDRLHEFRGRVRGKGRKIGARQ